MSQHSKRTQDGPSRLAVNAGWAGVVLAVLATSRLVYAPHWTEAHLIGMGLGTALIWVLIGWTMARMSERISIQRVRTAAQVRAETAQRWADVPEVGRIAERLREGISRTPDSAINSFLPEAPARDEALIDCPPFEDDFPPDLDGTVVRFRTETERASWADPDPALRPIGVPFFRTETERSNWADDDTQVFERQAPA